MRSAIRRRYTAGVAALVLALLALFVAGCSQHDDDTAVALQNTAVPFGPTPRGVDLTPIRSASDNGVSVPGLEVQVTHSGVAESLNAVVVDELVDDASSSLGASNVQAAEGQSLFVARLVYTIPQGLPITGLNAAGPELAVMMGDTEIELLGEVERDSHSQTWLAMSVPSDGINDLVLEVTTDDHVEKLRLHDGVRTHSDVRDRHGYPVTAEADDVWWETDGLEGFVSAVTVLPALTAEEGVPAGWAADGSTFVGLQVGGVDVNETSTLTLRLDDGTELEPISDSPNAFSDPRRSTTWFEVPLDASEMTVLVNLSRDDGGVPVEAGPIEVPLRFVTD